MRGAPCWAGGDWHVQGPDGRPVLALSSAESKATFYRRRDKRDTPQPQQPTIESLVAHRNWFCRSTIGLAHHLSIVSFASGRLLSGSQVKWTLVASTLPHLIR